MKKILFFTVVVALLVILDLSVGTKEERLTTQQIENLREIYPVYGDINKISPLIEVAQVETTLEEVSKKAYTFVYGEIIDEVPVHSIYSYAKFYGYRVRVFKDSKKNFASGDEITIIANTEFRGYNPSLSNGMKVVLPVGENKGRYYFDAFIYYVTDDGFVLSAFDESKHLDKEYSGIKVEKLLEEI